ncbi:MAG TPA: hypothetical protein VFS43_06340 [Polyangiaceae bacterium]|nr:hypothetical protein [Polyangiaceae bacterium]
MTRPQPSFLLSLAGTAGFAALVVAASCSSDYEVDPQFCARNPSHPECASDGVSGTGGVGGTGGGGTGGAGTGGLGGSGGSGGAAGSPMPTGCEPGEQPDEAKGIFVDAKAAPGGNGTRAAPFASLADAAAALAGRAGAAIYLKQGDLAYTLVTSLALPGLAGGLVLDGGWAGDWQRDCSADAAGKTLVNGVAESASPVLKFEGGQVTLRRLTVQTIGQAPPPQTKEQSGTSLIAVHIADGTGLLVEAAVLRAGNAGDGAPASSPGSVTGTRACNGRSDCEDGGTITTPGPAGGTDAAKFAAAGYGPGNGQDGQDGTDGKNGTAGGIGTEALGCFICGGDTQAACEASTNLPVSDQISADGKCGCGGKGGAPGRGGKGGGASVALWVGGPSASVNVVASQLVSGNGGRGSEGGQGSVGASGSFGSDGAPQCGKPTGKASCVWDATDQACLVFPVGLLNNTTIGSPGGPGGSGGPGGPGGPGAGGPSYALVSPNGSTVQVDASSDLIAGQGGLGGDSATRADAAEQKTY